MKRMLAMVLIFLLPWAALADAPPAFARTLQKMSDAEFARQCETVLAGTSLAGSTVTEKDGEPVVARNEYYAFAVMERSDGLLMLCHFTPLGEGLLLQWHNDLLISYYQDISLTQAGASWSGGQLPDLRMNDNWTVTITLCQPDGTRLALTGDLFRNGWRVTEMMLYTASPAGNWSLSLVVPEDCLAEDIYLATCKPDNWRRGEVEAADMYGW